MACGHNKCIKTNHTGVPSALCNHPVHMHVYDHLPQHGMHPSCPHPPTRPCPPPALQTKHPPSPPTCVILSRKFIFPSRSRPVNSKV
jgi:hypothetical protein